MDVRLAGLFVVCVKRMMLAKAACGMYECSCRRNCDVFLSVLFFGVGFIVYGANPPLFVSSRVRSPRGRPGGLHSDLECRLQLGHSRTARERRLAAKHGGVRTPGPRGTPSKNACVICLLGSERCCFSSFYFVLYFRQKKTSSGEVRYPTESSVTTRSPRKMGLDSHC